MDIIDRIINIRKQRGISQQKLSEMTGILQPVIARVESKKSSPTVEFLQKILDALDLDLTLEDSFQSPPEIMKYIKGLSHARIRNGRSGDKIFNCSNKYLLKISDNKKALKAEQEKNDWISEHISGSKTVKYIEDNNQAYYLRTYINGHTLIQEQYINDPLRLIKILKNVVSIIRSLDSLDCPFKSFDNKGNDFIHGDLCLPNIVVDDNDNFLGFLDVSNSGKGDKQYDYCWLLWSFEYNLKTDRYNDILLKELKIKIDSSCYLQYVITNLMKK